MRVLLSFHFNNKSFKFRWINLVKIPYVYYRMSLPDVHPLLNKFVKIKFFFLLSLLNSTVNYKQLLFVTSKILNHKVITT